jgi:hypothetical protein
MKNRNRYLTSDNGGIMWSDYLATKKQLQAMIKAFDDELLDHLSTDSLGTLLDVTEEVADAELRKNERFLYIKQVENWLSAVKKAAKNAVKLAAKPAQNKAAVIRTADLDEQLLSQEVHASDAVAESEKSLPPISLDNIKKKSKAIKDLLSKMEEARQSERYLEVYEMRVQPGTRKVKLDALKYNHQNGAYQLEEKEEERPDFKIVTGGRRLKDHDDVVVFTTQEEYLALQELGVTAARETTLIAKLINDYGVYRREILNAAIRFQAKTDTWVVKETICQQTISRLRALQDLESAYGAPINEIQAKIVSYEKKVTDLKQAAELQLAGLMNDSQVYSKEEVQWLKDVVSNHIDGLNDDLKQLKKLQKKPADAITEKTLAHWLLKQSEHIIESGKLSAELVDISGKKGISKGRFSDVTANAFERARTFDFPPNRRVYPAHQGIFDPTAAGHELILTSAELARDERGMRDVLFAFSCVKAGLTKNAQLKEVMEQSHARTVAHRGYGRMSDFWQRGKMRKAIDQQVAEAESLQMTQAVWSMYYTLRDKVRSTNESYGHAFKKVFSDMGKAVKDSTVGAAEEVTDVTVRFSQNIKRDFQYHPVVVLPHLNQNIQPLHHAGSVVNSEEKSECIQENFPAFHPWNPGTLYSVVDNFLLQFGGFFIKKYEASPFIWTMATLLGALSGATAVAGPAVKALLIKCHCPEALAEGFVNVSQAISTATTNSPLFQMIGTGSTVQQGLFVILDTLAAGADSVTAQAVAELKRNLPIAVCVIAGSTFGGWALGNFEVIREEFGTVPLIAEFFTGLKFAGFTYEAVMHEPGEKSALANTAASGMNGTYNLVRAVASFLQLIVVAPVNFLTCHPDEAKEALKNFLRPWLDLTDSGARFLMATLDVTLRCTTTLSRGGKSVAKAALETPINFIAKSARIVGLETLSKAIVKSKSTVGMAVDDLVTRPMHDVTRSTRRAYTQMMTQDDLYLGANPLRLSYSSHSFCQTLKKRNAAQLEVAINENEDESRVALLPSRGGSSS